mmetsp:Transcript_17905/g.25182  ORF Transcript_17905/g.25182 Transcript_17905/m.25182 type:complete len:362 (-) Transcript_17905:112-1197(-)|eukprot:CAMPEP_0175097226 /NCGR_PEP_ID=MMETSP0086_2-20121207/5169_1 /TAXON_ID=136419 /ORGANISM="Unknown Unknown, Strain D1" /LENGTH=361 /DNA_ID=CAMNT_0016370713 /DNA_START=46 /DNA_END=1131 /DNA_ORIENTATION=-
MRLLVCLAIVLVVVMGADPACPTVSNPQDRRPNKNKLRLVQYNVEWLFLNYSNAAKCPGTGCAWANESQATEHLDRIIKVLDHLKPDLVNMCEVQGCNEMHAVADSLDDGNFKPYLLKGTDTATAQNVAMLTKIDPVHDLRRVATRFSYPIDGSGCNYTGSFQNSAVSKHYISEFSVPLSTGTTSDRNAVVSNSTASGPSLNIAMVAAHLIAFPTDKRRCAQREAQAVVLSEVMAEYAAKGFELILLGDFNDYDQEVLDVNDSTPTSKVLDILKGKFGPQQGKFSLHSVAERVPKEKRFTCWYDKFRDCHTVPEDFTSIDHILLSSGLLDRVDDVSIYRGYEEFCGKIDSDHYPIVVDLKL